MMEENPLGKHIERMGKIKIPEGSGALKKVENLVKERDETQDKLIKLVEQDEELTTEKIEKVNFLETKLKRLRKEIDQLVQSN